MRRFLLGTTFLRNKPDDAPAGGAPAAVVDVAAAPVVVADAAPAAPVVDVAPVAEVVAPAAPDVAPAPAADAFVTDTLLGQAASEAPKADEKPVEPAKADVPADAKPVDAKPDEAPKADAKPGDAPVVEPAAPVVYDLKVPETVKADPEAMTAYTGILAEHKISPEVGQALLDRHIEAMTKFAETTLQDQIRTFGETRQGWRKEVASDEQIGGAGHETAMRAIAGVRDKLVPAADRAAFNQFLLVTGAGDHPQFLKMLHRAARFVNEPHAPALQGNPSPQNGKPPGRQGLRSIYAATDAAKRTNS